MLSWWLFRAWRPRLELPATPKIAAAWGDCGRVPGSCGGSRAPALGEAWLNLRWVFNWMLLNVLDLVLRC
eukprot:6514958-Alexandrium_andersonii.AAC.1